MAKLPLMRWKMLGYHPNKWATVNVHGREERFIVGTTCRQAGKTWVAALEVDIGMTTPAHPVYGAPVVGVAAPELAKAENVVFRWYEMVIRAFGTNYALMNKNRHEVVIPSTGARLVWMSTGNPDSLVGWTFSRLIIDEGQYVPDSAWKVLYPTTSVREAPIRVFGTPDITPDQTWFQGLWMRGQEGEENYHSFTLSCYENRWISDEEIAEAMRNLDTRTFKMLYLGQWVNIEGSVFEQVENAFIDEKYCEYVPGRNYVLTYDPALTEDYNVVMLGETSSRRVIRMWRWNKTDLTATYDRVYRIWEEHGQPPVVMDANGIGSGMLWELRNRGMNVQGSAFSRINKMPMVYRLSADIQHGRIRFPAWDILVRELRAFLFTKTPSGLVGAQAAATYHDDCVVALIMLNEAMRANTNASGGQYDYRTSHLDPSRPVRRILIGD